MNDPKTPPSTVPSPPPSGCEDTLEISVPYAAIEIAPETLRDVSIECFHGEIDLSDPELDEP